jgi:hypothetical protein
MFTEYALFRSHLVSASSGELERNGAIALVSPRYAGELLFDPARSAEYEGNGSSGLGGAVFVNDD